MSHSPGPWQFCAAHEDRGGCQCGIVWSTPVDHPVAKALSSHEDGDVSHDEMVANARLIAAAPEMLEMLRRLEWREDADGELFCYQCAGDRPDHATNCELAALIKKASGET